LIIVAHFKFFGVELWLGRSFINLQDCGGVFGVHKIARVSVKSGWQKCNLIQIALNSPKKEESRSGGPQRVKHECDGFVDTGGCALQEVQEFISI
jgi:hypothetical protein